MAITAMPDIASQLIHIILLQFEMFLDASLLLCLMADRAMLLGHFMPLLHRATSPILISEYAYHDAMYQATLGK